MAKTPISVYLSDEDKKRLEAIMEELGVARHALMQYAVLDFIGRYEAGEAKPKMESQPVLIPYEPGNDETDES